MSAINAASFLPQRQTNLPSGPDPSYIGAMGRLGQTVAQPMPGGTVPRGGNNGQSDAQLLDIVASQMEGAQNRNFQSAQQAASIAAQQQMQDQSIQAQRGMHSETLAAQRAEGQKNRAFEDAAEARRSLLEDAREQMRVQIEQLDRQHQNKQALATEAFKLGASALAAGGGPEPGTEARAQLDRTMQEAGRIMESTPLDTPQWADIHERYASLQASVLGVDISSDSGMANLRKVADAQRSTRGMLSDLPPEVRPKGPDGLPVADSAAVKGVAGFETVSDGLVTGMMAMYNQQGIQQDKFRAKASQIIKTASQMKTMRTQQSDLRRSILRTDPTTGQHASLEGMGSAVIAGLVAQPNRPPMEVLMETLQTWSPGVAQALTESGSTYDPVSYGVATEALTDIANRVTNDLNLLQSSGDIETPKDGKPTDADAAIGAFRRMAPTSQDGQSPWINAPRANIRVAANAQRTKVRELLGSLYQAEAGLRAKWGPNHSSAQVILDGLIGPEGQLPEQNNPLLQEMARTLVNAKTPQDAEQQMSSWFENYSATNPQAQESIAILRGERSTFVGPPTPPPPLGLDQQGDMMGSLGMGPNPQAPATQPLGPSSYTTGDQDRQARLEQERNAARIEVGGNY